MARPLDALPGDVKRKVQAMERAVVRDRAAIVRKAATEAAEQQRQVIVRDSGGDSRLSGVNRARGRAGNTRVGVRVRVRADEAEVVASGPLQIIDRNTSGHVIRSAYSSNSRGTTNRRRGSGRGFIGPSLPGQFNGGRQAVLKIPGVGFRRSVRHPGTRGKDTWARGKRQALPAADREIDRESTRRLTQAFRSGLG